MMMMMMMKPTALAHHSSNVGHKTHTPTSQLTVCFCSAKQVLPAMQCIAATAGNKQSATRTRKSGSSGCYSLLSSNAALVMALAVWRCVMTMHVVSRD
jgi:hypothetical protein